MVVTKKIMAGILLFATALPLLLFLFFICLQKYNRVQMEEKLEAIQLTTITMSANDFKWHKKGKEIIYCNHFFDVKIIVKLKGNELLITGLYDYQEQELHESIAKMHNKNSDKTTFNLIQKLLAFVVAEPVYNRLDYFSLQAISSPFYFYHPGLRYCYLPIIIPPPKVV